MRWRQRAVRKEKKRGGTTPAATAFRHVTFLLTSGCNTHAPHYWLSLCCLSQTHKIWRSLTCTDMHAHTPMQPRYPHNKRKSKAFSRSFFWVLVLVFSALYQASSQSYRGGLVGWLRIFRAVLLPLWVSTVACSHAPQPSARETWSQYLQAYTHVLTHTHSGTGSTEKTKSEDVCGPSGSMHLSLESREAGMGEPSCSGGMMRQAKTLRDRWTGQRVQTDCLRF